MKTETMWIKLIKRVFCIPGILDEYKQNEMNRIGMSAFMISFVYGIFSTFGFLFGFVSLERDQLLLLIFGNVFIYFFVLPLYIGTAVKRSGLTEIDLDVTEYPQAKRNAIIGYPIRGIIFGLLMFIYSACIHSLFDDAKLTHVLTDGRQLLKWLVIGLVFGVVMAIYQIARLKKAVKDSQQDN